MTQRTGARLLGDITLAPLWRFSVLMLSSILLVFVLAHLLEVRLPLPP